MLIYQERSFLIYNTKNEFIKTIINYSLSLEDFSLGIITQKIKEERIVIDTRRIMPKVELKSIPIKSLPDTELKLYTKNKETPKTARISMLMCAIYL